MKEATPNPSARSTRFSAIIQSIVTLILAAFILGMINYLSFKYYRHFDLSKDQILTLSSKTQDVLHSLSSPVTVYVFPIFNPQNGQPDMGKETQIMNLLREYSHEAPESKFIVEKLDPRDGGPEITTLAKQVHFNSPFNNVVIKFGTQYKLIELPDLYDESNPYIQVPPFKGEPVITSALVAMQDPKVPKIYFTTGHGERSIKDQTPSGCAQLEILLRQDNLDALEFSLSNQGDVPPDASAVVVLAPQSNFAPFEVQAISRYLDSKGHLVLLEDLQVKSGLEDLLAKYSLRINNDIIFTHISQTNQTLPVALVQPPEGVSRHPVTAKFADQGIQFLFSSFRSISYGFTNNKDLDAKTTFLLRTSESPVNWGMTKPLNPAMTTEDLANLTFDPKTDNKAPLTVAALFDENFMPGEQKTAADEPPSTKIVVFGGSSFLANEEIGRNPYPANIFDNCLDWMTKKNPILAIDPKPAQQYTITMSPMQSSAMLWITVVVIPATFLLMAIFTWFSRRK